MKKTFANKLYEYYKIEETIYKKYNLLSSNDIIDENQSVKWNREEVVRRNEQTKKDMLRCEKEASKAYQELLEEIFNYYKVEYSEILKTFAQFKYIWERSVDDSLCYGYHSVMEDFEGRLDDFEEFRKLGELE